MHPITYATTGVDCHGIHLPDFSSNLSITEIYAQIYNFECFLTSYFNILKFDKIYTIAKIKIMYGNNILCKLMSKLC